MKFLTLVAVSFGVLVSQISSSVSAELAAPAAVGTVVSPANNVSVTVEINNSTYVFDSEPRVSEVLARVALKQNWYWPASKLYRLEKTDLNGFHLNETGLNSTSLDTSKVKNHSPEELRATVLQQLAQLQQSAQPALQPQLTALQLQVTGWQLAKRVFIPIDYDLARAQAPFNPRFEPGIYKLQLVERPDSVVFWGAVAKTSTLVHRGATAVADYLPAIDRPAYADLSLAYIIQPDGKLIKTGVASWNRQHVEAMPGAQVYIPFASEWFGSELDNLNQNLLALALYRVEQ